LFYTAYGLHEPSI